MVDAAVPGPAPTPTVDPLPVEADAAPVPAPVDASAVVVDAAVPEPTAAQPVVSAADPAPAPDPAPSPSVTAGGRQPILFWVGSKELDDLAGGGAPVNLDSLRQAGVGGYAVITGSVEGFGGGSIPDWMVSEWRSVTSQGQQLYPGVYAASPTSPFADLFDDGQWAAVRAGLSHLASRASEAGATGLALDLENYGVSEALWSVRYPGNTHDEATTRAKIRQRAEEIAPILASAGPVIIYTSSIASAPGTYQDAVAAYAGNGANVYADNMFPDFVRGLLAGGARVTVIDSVFTDGVQLPNRSWDGAIAESVRLTQNVLPGTTASIMVWPENHGSLTADAAWPVFDFASRLSTGPVVIYQQHLTDGSFDYGPYLAALRAAVT